MKYATTDGDVGVPVFDAEYLGQQQERYKKVFPQWDIGLAGTGQVVPEVDLQIHRSLSNLNESPVYMLFNPRADLGGGRGTPGRQGSAAGPSGRSVAGADGGGASTRGGGEGSGAQGGIATKDLPISLFETVVNVTEAGTASDPAGFTRRSNRRNIRSSRSRRSASL